MERIAGLFSISVRANDEELTLETSDLELFMVVNLHRQLGW